MDNVEKVYAVILVILGTMVICSLLFLGWFLIVGVPLLAWIGIMCGH